MIYIQILLFAVAGALSGIKEGQVMIRGGDTLFSPPSFDASSFGVRCHKYFKWYHVVGTAQIAACMGCGALLALF